MGLRRGVSSVGDDDDDDDNDNNVDDEKITKIMIMRRRRRQRTRRRRKMNKIFTYFRHIDARIDNNCASYSKKRS